ncbi:MAG: hypothetical protein HY671_01080 [Chloroflexi bacterium]|nr:hypothetical protein [Chloroflexota bacterium]
MQYIKDQHDESKTVFEGYLNLQSESYEFITRTIAIHNWLTEAYKTMQENPQLTAEELCETWRPAFVQVYRHLFAAFLRPYHMALFPFGESHELQREFLEAKGHADLFQAASQLWIEAPSAFMKGFYGETPTPKKKTRHSLAVNGRTDIDELLTVTPFNLMVKVADEEAKVYLDTLEKIFGTLGEAEFLFPKDMVVHMHKVLSIQPKIYALAEKYESMLQSAWEESLHKFCHEVKKTSEPMDFKAFFGKYAHLLSEEYDRLLGSHEFIEVQSTFVALTAEMTTSLRQALEAQLEVFPHFPLVTVSKMAALAKNVHTYKRKIGNLERRVMDLEERLGAIPEASASKGSDQYARAVASPVPGDVR